MLNEHVKDSLVSELGEESRDISLLSHTIISKQVIKDMDDTRHSPSHKDMDNSSFSISQRPVSTQRYNKKGNG
jgi:hypothetical protein